MIGSLHQGSGPRLKVGWFIPVNHPNYDKLAASLWIRCLQLIPYLEAHGIQSTVNDASARPDVAVFVRHQDDTAYDTARRLKDDGVPVVFDVCVNYFHEAQVPELGVVVTPHLVDECLRMVALADVVTTASRHIAERAQAHHDRVVYVPDSVNRSHFRFSKGEAEFDRRPIRAVWSGVAPKAVELEPILPLLAERSIPLTVIAERPPALKVRSTSGVRDFEYTYREWRYESFPREILGGEICLSHRRTDNPYNQGHSHFKIAVFLSAGVPALASPVPSYRDILDQHECGTICESPEDWAGAFDRIVSDPGLLKHWSRQCRAAVECLSTDRVARQYVDVFQSLK